MKILSIDLAKRTYGDNGFAVLESAGDAGINASVILATQFTESLKAPPSPAHSTFYASCLIASVFAVVLLVYLCAVGAYRAFGTIESRLIVAAICILLGLCILVWSITLNERELEFRDNMKDLMRSIEYAILSDRSAEAATILHDQSDQLVKHPEKDWIDSYNETETALDKLDTNNRAVETAKESAE